MFIPVYFADSLVVNFPGAWTLVTFGYRSAFPFTSPCFFLESLLATKNMNSRSTIFPSPFVRGKPNAINYPPKETTKIKAVIVHRTMAEGIHNFINLVEDDLFYSYLIILHVYPH